MKPRVASIIAALAVAAATVLAVQSPASAAVKNNCGAGGKMCLFHNSPAYGLNAEFGSNDAVYSFNYNVNGGIYYRFKAGSEGSNGAGEIVWNNAGGAGNYSTYRDFAVWYNTGYDGPHDVISERNFQRLYATYNEDTSMAWVN